MPEPKKHTATFTPPSNPSPESTPEWVYNELMRFIEPDLMTTVVPHHAEMYQGESREQTINRMKHYDDAFAAFDVAAKNVEADAFAQVRALKNQAQTEVHSTEQHEHAQEASAVEQLLDDPSPNDA